MQRVCPRLETGNPCIAMRSMLIVGGGFISQSIIKSMASVFEITVLTRFPDAVRSASPNIHVFIDVGDLVSAKLHFDLVVFCSGPSSPARITAEAANNCTLQLSLLLSGAISCEVFVYLSSGGAIYMPSVELLTEASLVASHEKYASMHLENEGLLGRQVQFRACVSLRLGNPFGEFQDPDRSVGFVTQSIKCAVERTELCVHGDGAVSRDFFHVDSISNLLLSSHLSELEGFHVFNFGSGVSHSLVEVIRCVESCFGVTLKTRFLLGESTCRPVVRLDVSKLKYYFPTLQVVGLVDGVELFRDSLIRKNSIRR